MKIQFYEQDYQLAAVNSAVKLFEGQPTYGAGEVSILSEMMLGTRLTEKGTSNSLQISDEALLNNCRSVQRQNNLKESNSLELMELQNGDVCGEFPNFTIEMETGTGKTYVYLRTIYELNRNYGFKKFVIVVPSIPIREGVLKNLEITHDHFQSLYNYEPINYSVYDSSKVNLLRNFAISNAIQILVISIDSFSKDAEEIEEINGSTKKKKNKGNIINQVRETGIRPIEYIQSTNPIVIIDEPQNMETDIRKVAIARLNPMCTLRYSATPKSQYNLIYQLDPIKAFDLGLVKQISVDSVLDAKDFNHAYIEIVSFKPGKRSITAKLIIWFNSSTGVIKKSFTVKNGDDLYKLSNGRETYKDGFIVNEIDAEAGIVRFANDLVVRQGTVNGEITDEILRLQIETTIKRHFEKELKLSKLGIKVLSVFFIDSVENYRMYPKSGVSEKGKFALWFEEIFENYRKKNEYKDLYGFSAEKAHNGYFAKDKRAITPFEFKEAKSNNEAETNTYELIMKDKERLLDPNEPLRFVFSHSALREGWDNPNVFQICTLAESSSEIKKRQEIGRGLRLCVDKNGVRQTDKSINRLTVIANESYEDFANNLQTEFEQAGVKFKKDIIKNEKDKVIMRLKENYALDPNFLSLWEKISQRTRYRVRYNSEKLISDASDLIANMPLIEKPKIAISRADLIVSDTGVKGEQKGYQTREYDIHYVMPDLVSQIQAKTALSKTTVAKIVLQSKRLKDALNNPQAYIEKVSELINATKLDLIVAGVEYSKVDEFYEMQAFEEDDLKEIILSNSIEVKNIGKTIFSHIVVDSGSSPEREFINDCENNEDVFFYMKLPRWFIIDTPVGSYNPDWALVYNNNENIYFIAETKGTGGKGKEIKLDLLRPKEQLKIECGIRHYSQYDEIIFKPIRSLEDLLG